MRGTAAAWVSIGLSMIAVARAGDTVDGSRKPIRIPPEELRVALPALGEIEGLHLVFLSEDVDNRNTSGVSGSLTAGEALEQLLRGTGLTYRFLEAHTVMILPAGLALGTPVEPNSTSRSAGNTGQDVGAPVEAGDRGPQVTVTAKRLSDAQKLEYFRRLAAASRADYRRLVKALRFVDSGTVTFHGFEPPLGQDRQSKGMNGIVLSRVFSVTPDKIERRLEAYNGNPFPVFIEIDSETLLGNGAYAALAPGETAIWTWRPLLCPSGVLSGGMPGEADQSHGLLRGWGCTDYLIQPGTFRLQMLEGW